MAKIGARPGRPALGRDKVLPCRVEPRVQIAVRKAAESAGLSANTFLNRLIVEDPAVQQMLKQLEEAEEASTDAA